MIHPWKILLLSLLLFLVTIDIQGQEEPIKLTLKEVIKIAQEQSPDAQIAKHRFRRSYWQYRSYKANYLPLVQLSGELPNISREFRKITVPGEGDVFQYNSYSNASLQLDIDQKIGFTGGSVFITSSLQRLENYYANDSTTTSWQSVPVIVGYRQPIAQFNQYRYDKTLEPLQYEKAKRTYQEDMEQVAINAINHYFNLLLAQLEVKISLKNLNNYDTLYRIALGRFNLGKIAENELLQLELNYLNAKASVDIANLNLNNMLFRLKSYLRIKDDNLLELVPALETTHIEINPAKAISEARKNTSTSLEFDERLLAAESELRRAKMEGRFDADLYLEYGLTQSALGFPEVYDQPEDQQRLSLGVTVPLLDWGVAQGRIKMAESNQELEITSVEQELIDFEQNVYLKVVQFNMQKDQLAIAAKSDTVAQKRFDITQKRYMIGQVNDVLELNNAQIDNDNTKKSYYQTLRTYWVNFYELRKLTLFDFLNDQMLLFDIREIM